MIKQILSLLSDEQRKQLMYAFELERCQLVELDDDMFIGVNVEPTGSLVVMETAGAWAYGKLGRKDDLC